MILLTGEPQGALRLVLASQWVESGFRRLWCYSLPPRAGETRSWGQCQTTCRQSQVLESGCKALGCRAHIRSLGGEGLFLAQPGMRPWLSQGLCWSASGQGQCSTGPSLGCSLLCSLGPRLLDTGFLPSGVSPLVVQLVQRLTAGQSLPTGGWSWVLALWCAGLCQDCARRCVRRNQEVFRHLSDDDWGCVPIQLAV